VKHAKLHEMVGSLMGSDGFFRLMSASLQQGAQQQKSDLYDPVFLEKALRLCHPDRHAGANEGVATEVTKRLLEIRTSLKSVPKPVAKPVPKRRAASSRSVKSKA
jgi:hypothetical protein